MTSGVERSLLVTTIAQVAARLQTLFTTTADDLARRSGFVERSSKLTGALFAQALVFGWLANPDASLPQLAAAAALAGVSITPQGLDQRCTSAAAGFLESLLSAAVDVLVQADRVVIPLLERFTAVELLDASTIVLPDALGPWWPGCGGSSPTNTSAALKIHVRFDLCSGSLRGPLRTDGRTHESTTPLQTAPLPRGSLRIADLGFFCLTVLAAIAAEGSYFLSRMHHTTAVFTPEGQRTRLLDLLGPNPSYDLSVQLGCTQRLPVRLLAVRVPPEVANARRRNLKAAARKHGRTPTAERLAWADWTLLVTNAAADLLSLPEALVLLRARWQLELLFKLWKQHGRIDESRSSKPWRVLCEVWAKLLAVLVQHWLSITGCWQYPERSLVKAAQVVRAQAMHLLATLGTCSRLEEAITTLQRCLPAACRLNRRKKHPNTYQLLLNPDLLALEPAAA
jgi:Transposase DDE domain